MPAETTTMTLQIQCPVDVYRVLESHGLLGDLLATKTQQQLAASLYQEHVLSRAGSPTGTDAACCIYDASGGKTDSSHRLYSGRLGK